MVTDGSKRFYPDLKRTTEPNNDVLLYWPIYDLWPPMHPFTDVMNVKLASSAGHVAGRSLIAAESFTWLDNHFHTMLQQMKTAVDRILLGGANHIFFHGTAYSPAEVPHTGPTGSRENREPGYDFDFLVGGSNRSMV